MKIFLKVCLYLAAAVLVAALTMPLWFNLVVGGVLRSAVPAVTETGFRLDNVSFNPYTCRLYVEECHLCNPEGYAAGEAFGVKLIDVRIRPWQLFRNRLHFVELTVNGTFVSYLSHLDMNNFAWIAERLWKNLEKYGIRKSEKKEKEEKEPLKLVIEKLCVSDTRIQLGKLPFAIPVMPLTLSGIGVEEDGLTFAEVCDRVWLQVQKAMSGIGDAMTGGMKAVSDGAGSVSDAAGKLIKAADGLFGK